MHRFEHLHSRIPIPHLRDRLRAVDLAILDMDGSLHWGITQGIAAMDLFRRVALRPERLADRRFLPRLALAGLAVGGLRAHYGRFRSPERYRQLIALWCWGFRDVPMAYFRAAVEGIPGRSFPWVRRTIERLARHAAVGIISVGLDQVVHEYVRQFNVGGRRLITFHHCNRLVTGLKDGRLVFAGRYAEPMILSAEDKAALGRRLIDDRQARHPLVIGNDEGDAPLARLAQECGGLAVGVRPPWRLRRAFTAYLRKRDWSPLARLLA